jgi:seryl-tRNA synthetase
MLDIRDIRRTPETYTQRLALRGGDVGLTALLELDAQRRELIVESDQLRQSKGETERGMRTADRSAPEFAEFRDKMRAVAQEIKGVAEKQRVVEEQLEAIVLTIPNVPHESVQPGADESSNVVVNQWGTQPSFSFEPLPHWEVAGALGLLDFEAAAKITGARFAVYRGALARLERALISFMLDLHTTQHGYTEILPPFLVNPKSMQGTGQFPKFKDDAFILERDDLVLIPTAEVPLTNLHRDEIIDEGSLPIRYTAYTPCFRREAGAYGRDTRGLIRQHQFQKVELVQFVEPEQSTAALDALTGHAESILQALGLHYRKMDLCAGDLGFSATRTFDLEVWLPSQNTYREISSCSSFGDFQARRAAIRYRAPGEKKPKLVHTLNGSGLAVGRTVVAILENFQQADGSVTVPEVLRPYMGGLESIGL